MNKKILLTSLITLVLSLAYINIAEYIPLLSLPAENKQLKPEPNKQLKSNLKKHVDYLSIQIGQRNLVNPGSLTKSQQYITSELSSCSDQFFTQEYKIGSDSFTNVAALKKGKTDQLLVIGAHYDSIEGSQGANDNATGIGALIEICKTLKAVPLVHSILFVGFVNEEPPYFQTPDMGSYHFAQKLFNEKANVIGMLSLETLGAYYNEPDSQQYPDGVPPIYPDTGNFLAFISNPASFSLTKSIIEKFRNASKVPSESLITPEQISGVDFSDHWAFWQFGYPAVMITDTAFYRYPHYHTSFDTPDKVDFNTLSLVTEGLGKAIIEIDRAL